MIKKILLPTLLLTSIGLLFGQKGQFRWAERSLIHNSAAKFQGKTILVDPDKNVFLFGTHSSSANAQFQNNDMILAKYDSLGKRMWYQKYPTETFAGHGSYKMYWDDNYNIIVAGEMNTIFGTDTLNKYTSSITPTFAVVKFDSSGNYIWSTQIDANLDDDFDFIQLALSLIHI